MAESLFYVDRSEILEGRVEEARDSMRDLAAFVAEREPQLIAYRFYLDEATSMMSVIAVHPDSASMERHLEIGDPKFRAFGTLIRMLSIDVYGHPSSTVVDRLRRKAEYLGGASLTFHTLQAGFSRLDRP
ncbi:hypothetical protein ACFTWS_30590 [Streptomyces sp. NPDC057027]|uniref:hypothetical protein n=1 Tax=Streptomyces sp. NPDC057027 TaxID=3346004 RepID=UPI00362F8834